MTDNFDDKLNNILEGLGSSQDDLIQESKYAKWFDQKGREVYPKVLSIKQMKRVLKRRMGFFQKGGHIYSLPVFPSKGKVQKEFKKFYRPTLAPRPIIRHGLKGDK